MDKNRLALSFMVFASCFALWLTFKDVKTPSVFQPVSYSIRSIELGKDDPNKFNIVLNNGIIVQGKLTAVIANESRAKIIDFLSEANNPKVLLKGRQEGVWIVDVLVELNGKNVSLTEWLKINKLAYQTF